MRFRNRITGVLAALAILFALVRDPKAQAGSASVEHGVNPGKTLAIIVNRSNPVNNLSFAELRKIFLGERNHWQNGHRIAIAMLDYGQVERRTVLHLVYHMDEHGYQEYLLRVMFRGDVFQAPKTLASPLIVRKFVFNAPGAIGYVRASDVDDSVKVVRIDGLLPEDKNYRLQIDEPSDSRE